MSWKIGSFSQGKYAFQISWAHKFVYAFPSFALIERVLQKVNQDQCLMLIITSAWPGQPWFTGLLKMSVKNQLLLAALKDLLKDPAGKLNPLVIQNSLRLVVWTISSRTYLQKEYQKWLWTLSQTIGNIFNQALQVCLEEVVLLVFWTGDISHYMKYKLRTKFFGRIIWKGVGIQDHWDSQVCDICVSWPNWEHLSRQSPKSICTHVRYILQDASTTKVSFYLGCRNCFRFSMEASRKWLVIR